MGDRLDPVRDYYDTRGESEWHRLAAPFDGGVEWELHGRVLTELLPPKCRVLDIGGGPGRWTIWLARRGYRVVLADLSGVQLEIARREIAAAAVLVEDVLELDARDLSLFDDASFDAVLALGPFYHLTEQHDRQRAASEAARVLRPGGRLFASVMTRYTWVLNVLMESGSKRLDDVQLLRRTGQYRDPEQGRFTEAYLHEVGEVAPFFEGAGLLTCRLMASQGFLGPYQEQVAALRERDEAAWRGLMEVAYETSSDPSILGLSAYLLYIGDRR